MICIAGWTGGDALAAVEFEDGSLRDEVIAGMRRAAEYFRNEVAVHGGYVYHYSLDLKTRWGEGLATATQIWVQPPGTPTVGMAYLKAFEATGDEFYREAATDAAEALVYGQLESGGWSNSIDFDPDGRTARYRNGRGRGKNNSSLDDGQTQSALRLLILVDEAHEFKHVMIHEAARLGLEALLAAQFPNGAFPQIWTEPVEAQPVLRAGYPDYNWRTEGRIKNYWDMYTLNDNVPGYLVPTLKDAHRVYGERRFLDALRGLGDFLLLAQMPEPQPGWAQQYNYGMKPIWARRFEPAAIAGDESQEVLETLMDIHEATGDAKYLEPIPRALDYLRRSLLEDGRLARFYELKTNRPLYMFRRADVYTLTYEDGDLPGHYAWKIDSHLEAIERRYERLKSGGTREALDESSAARRLENQARRILEVLDSKGRWIIRHEGARHVGQPEIDAGARLISSQVFSRNLERLSEFVEATRHPSPALPCFVPQQERE